MTENSVGIGTVTRNMVRARAVELAAINGRSTQDVSNSDLEQAKLELTGEPETACGEVERGIAICGRGVGASVCANKVAGVRAGLIHECFSAHQGVEDDDLNVVCLGGLVVGRALAWELVQGFLAARFTGAERHRRRLAKVAALENTL